jgi:hypothetical protein
VGESYIIIQQGVPEEDPNVVTFLGTGSAGDKDACRRLVFPSSVSTALAPLVYAISSGGICLNPTRTFNLDNAVLPHPITQAVRTIGSTRTIRFEENIEDVIVTELWEPRGGSSMPTGLFRLFYDYLINSRLIPAQGPYIVWEPRDRTTKKYNVTLLSLSVGEGEDDRRFDVADLRAQQGVIDNGIDDLIGPDTVTGLIDRSVRLIMRVISEEP